jgi:hypothetical protein
MTELTPKQKNRLAMYHSANARFHHTQCELLKEFQQPQGTSDVFTPLYNYHNRLAKKHQKTAEALSK